MDRKRRRILKEILYSMSSEDIAIYLNRTPHSIWKKAHKLRIAKCKRISEYDQEIKDLLDNNYYIYQISKKLHISESSLRNYLVRNNIEYKVKPRNERENGLRRQISANYRLTMAMKEKGA